MAIRTLFTRGYGNGTFNGTIAFVVTKGYAIGAVADATTITVAAITGGADLTTLSYAVFSAARIGVVGTTLIKQGEDETTDSNGDLVVDLTGLGVALGTTLTIIITNYTTAPALTDRGAVCFADAA